MIVRRFPRAIATALSVAFISIACQPADRSDPADEAEATAEPAGDAPVVEVTAADYTFQAPDSIPSGWTTFRLVNAGAETHFVLFDRLPEGHTFRDLAEEVGPAFDSVWYRLRDGDIDKAEAGAMLGQLLPEWYGSVQQTGGTGLVAPGMTTQTTVNLEPGNYVMECYVKTPDGEFHVSLGMARPLTVTEGSTGATPPGADLEITLSNAGMTVEGQAESGANTVAVHFQEQPAAGLGNDLHLVRLEDGVSATDLAPWMDWMNVDGLRAPAPATFIGGTQEMPVGNTAYFTVELEPGRYAWISEATTEQVKTQEFAIE